MSIIPTEALESPHQPAPPDSGLDPESETPTPREQALYDSVVNKAIAFVSSPENDQVLADMLQNPRGTTAENVGKATAFVVRSIGEAAKSQGVEIPPDVMMGAGEEVTEVMMEQASKAYGVIDENDPKYDATLNQAFLEAVKAYGEAELAGPNAAQLTSEAQDAMVRGIAAEADAGTLDPNFLQAVQQMRADGAPGSVSEAVKREVPGG